MVPVGLGGAMVTGRILTRVEFLNELNKIWSECMSEEALEKEIKEKGLTAPRVTLELIDSKIASEQYHVFPGTMVTVCCLTLLNGFNVMGESACASPSNFNEELGRKIARGHARDKIWALEGYLLKQSLMDEELGKHDKA